MDACGIARFAAEGATRLTQTGLLIGSIMYMAPEQFSGTSDALTNNGVPAKPWVVRQIRAIWHMPSQKIVGVNIDGNKFKTERSAPPDTRPADALRARCAALI